MSNDKKKADAADDTKKSAAPVKSEADQRYMLAADIFVRMNNSSADDHLANARNAFRAADTFIEVYRSGVK